MHKMQPCIEMVWQAEGGRGKGGPLDPGEPDANLVLEASYLEVQLCMHRVTRGPILQQDR